MDNLTHTLIGALVGEAVARSVRPTPDGIPESMRRTAFVTMMAIGSNVPDLDFLYSTITASKLDYLLHHRGHTHTVPGILLIAAILFWGARAWLARTFRTVSARDARWLAIVALLAPLLHVTMDLGNNYGVHPLWPLWNGWLYGDAIFIIEPLFWASCAPLVFTLRTRLGRIAVATVLAVGIALVLYTRIAPIALVAMLALLTIALLLISRQLTPRAAAWLGVASWLSITAMFVATSRIAEARASHYARDLFPEARLLEAVVTPMPVNPICWEVMLVQTDTLHLTTRRAMLSLSPQWLAAAACPTRSLEMQITAPREVVGAASSSAWQWHGEFATSLSQLRQLWQERCEVSAFMRFARVPWVASIEDHLVIGDLRYDREAALGFAELSLADRAACPRVVPNWAPPRQDLDDES